MSATPQVPFDKKLWDNKTVRYSRGFHSSHDGVDWAMPIGTNILAAQSGIVRIVTRDKYGGLYIYVEGDDGRGYMYLHISKSLVRVGQRIKKGQHIAESGNTGYVLPKPTKQNPTAGAHLHFEIHAKYNNWKSSINPIGLIKWAERLQPKPKPSPAPKKDPKDDVIAGLKKELANAQNSIEEIESKYQANIQHLNQQLVSLKESKLDQEKSYLEQEESLFEKITELENELAEITDLPIESIDIESLASDAITDEYDDEITSLQQRWKKFVDSKFESKMLRSIFSYDIFVAVGIGLSYLTLEIPELGIPNYIQIGLSITVGILYKLLVTRYDSNNNQILDKSDFQVIDKYIPDE